MESNIGPFTGFLPVCHTGYSWGGTVSYRSTTSGRGENSPNGIRSGGEGDFATAETLWTDLIARFPSNPAVWSNRGNTRVSQNKIEAAIEDYNKAIQLAPDAPTPISTAVLPMKPLVNTKKPLPTTNGYWNYPQKMPWLITILVMPTPA